MLEIKRVFKLLRRTLLPVLLVGLVWLSGLPNSTSAQASPSNFPAQGQDLSKTGVRPYGEGETANIKQTGKGDIEDAKQAAENVDELVHQKNSQRPKTTGEFLEEARGDVPLNERLGNITRDSGEAFKDLGSEYSKAAREATRD